MNNRRNFLKKASAFLAANTLIFNNAYASRPKELFVHHVYFYLKEDTAENREKLTEGLKKLAKVPAIKMSHIGVPADTNRDVIVRDYSISWLCFFESKEKEEIYQKHPIHLKFIEDYSYLWAKVNVYDSVGPQR